MRLVVLESPFAGDRELNVRYARLCLKDCIRRGEAPIASHLLFPQCFDDDVAEERNTCMAAGHAWITKSDGVVVYTDFGISDGMRAGIQVARHYGVSIEYRELPGWNGGLG